MNKMTKRTLVLLVACAMGAGVSAQYNGYTLVWSDEFNGGYSNADATTGIDKDSWSFETGNGDGGWGTGQRDYATTNRENVEVSNGTLKIRTKRAKGSNPEYTSGRINTKNKHAFLYGKIEARIRTTNMTEPGRGFAFWLMPNGIPSGLNNLMWPQGGEIDIFEYNGLYPEYNLGSVHYCWGWNNNQWAGNGQHAQASNVYYETNRSWKFNSAGRDGCTGNHSMTTDKNNLLGSQWHVYGVNWYSDRIEFFVRPDGSTQDDVYHIFYLNNEQWCGIYSNNALGNVQCGTGWAYDAKGYNDYWRPFENPFYVILSAGVGGNNTYGGNITSGNNPDNWTCTTEIDWVRCYKLNSANPPMISLTYAQNGSDITVTPHVESGAAISKIEYVLDKVPVAATATTNPFTYTFTPSMSAHKVYARACNAQGYWGDWVSVRCSNDYVDPCANVFASMRDAGSICCNANWNCPGVGDYGGSISANGNTLTFNYTNSPVHAWFTASGNGSTLDAGTQYRLSGTITTTVGATLSIYLEQADQSDNKMFNGSINRTVAANTPTPFSVTATANVDMTDPKFVVNLEGQPAGTYTISNVTLKAASCPSVVDEPTMALQPECRVYPNPACDRVYVDCADVASVQVFGLDGKRLITKQGSANHCSLDVEGLHAGIYLVRVTTNAGQVIDRKLVKR